MKSKINGVNFKELATHADRRGFFREIVRVNDNFLKEGFGQLSTSMILGGVVKAWHMHKIQTDWWYVASGILRVGLCDMRPKSKTYKKTMDVLMGEMQPSYLLKIPPGVAHGCKAIQGPVNLIYVTSHTYNQKDELRLRRDDPEIEFDWTVDYLVT